MGRIFAPGNCAVMTAGAAPPNPGVVETGVGKIQCNMAIFTGIGTLDMARPFSHGDLSVMAAFTRADNGTMIHTKQALPTVGGMAVLTFILGGNMGYGAFRSPDISAPVMATDASFWGSLESSIHMTTVTFQGFMTPLQSETRGKMVKFRLCDSIRRQEGQRHYSQCHEE